MHVVLEPSMLLSTGTSLPIVSVSAPPVPPLEPAPRRKRFAPFKFGNVCPFNGEAESSNTCPLHSAQLEGNPGTPGKSFSHACTQPIGAASSMSALSPLN